MQFQSRTILATVALSIGLLSATGANAALVAALSGQVINDTDLNITWLANADLAATNTFGVSGIAQGGYMDWNTAQSWIGAMNTANYLGYNDWRQPISDGTCSGFNCTGSEIGHLFYNELGGVAGSSVNTSPFYNVRGTNYWSGTVYAPFTGYAWDFNLANGFQGNNYKSDVMYVFAVRPGQVAAVPVPAAAWLLGSGLLGLMGLARRKTA
jgi:hypothetical protein